MKHQTRITLAGMIGNLVEAFDMGLCGLLSVYFAKYLIGDATKGLFVVFFTFFAGYLARPVGAMVLGLSSDAYGRKVTLAASILSMGIATTLIGFVPPSNTIGSSALALLLILRIVQSFSCGAEYLNTSAYLVENAEDNRKGYFGSWASFGAMAGLLIASITAWIASYLISAHPELEWLIWRIPFIFALLGASIGLYIRLCIPESLEYIIYYTEHPKPKFSGLLQEAMHYIHQNKLQALYVFLLSLLGVTTTFQFYIYAPTQAHLTGYFSDQQILGSNIISLVVMLAVFPIIGKLSDQINRERIIIVASIGLFALAHLYFHTLAQNNYSKLVLIQSLISIPAGAYYATVPAMLAEMFPLNLRCTVLSILYATAASLAAGLTPLLSFILLKKTEAATAPALLTISLIVACLFVMWVTQLKTLKVSQVTK